MNSDKSLTIFFYLLLRDHLPAGTVSQLIQQSETLDLASRDDQLYRLAQDYARRLSDLFDKPIGPVEPDPIEGYIPPSLRFEGGAFCEFRTAQNDM